MHDELQRAERAILKALEEAEETYSPTQLIQHVKNLDGEELSEEVISVAMWNLVGKADVELTRDFKLKHTRPTTAA